MDKFSAKLASLGFALPHWCDPPTEELVAGFESRFSVSLPADYREFLVLHGGVSGSAVCPFQEPTPFGFDTIVEGFYGFGPTERGDDVTSTTELIDGAPSVIAIAGHPGSGMFWLKCDGTDAGHVYLHDGEQRAAWADEEFYDMYPNLSPLIKQYLAMRRKGTLPKKPPGYEHVYRLATSFTEFFEALQRNHYYDEKESPATFWDSTLAPLARKITFGIWPRENPGNRYDRICKSLMNCDDDLLKQLVAAGKLDEPLDYGWTPVQIVAGQMKPLQWLLDAGAELTGALSTAAGSGAVDAVRLLLDKGCPVDERIRGKTPLMKAVEFPYPPERIGEFIEVARLLIHRGADVNAISDDGVSVLSIAGGQRYSNGRTKGQPEVVAFLEAAGAQLKPSLPGDSS